jgi:OmpA-OmpF porin, OOP family
MARNQPVRLAPPAIVVSSILSLQTVEIPGVIKARSGATVQGLLKARRKEMSMAALVPGLQIQVEPTHHEQRQLMAKVIRFQGNDSERARAIQASLHEAQGQAPRNREDLEKNRREELEKQNGALKAQTKSLKQQQGELTAQQKRIAANQTAKDAAIPDLVNSTIIT